MFHLLQCSHHQGVQNYKKEIIYIKVMGEILALWELHILKYLFVYVQEKQIVKLCILEYSKLKYVKFNFKMGRNIMRYCSAFGKKYCRSLGFMDCGHV
jgi:hypothetical protein